MQYRNLSNTGLKLSKLSFGAWGNLTDKTSPCYAKKLIFEGFDLGINYFDNSEKHGFGVSEILMGAVLKDLPRDQLVISTKLFWGGENVNQIGLSRKHLHDGLNNSLKRLQVDYLDILYCHRFDPDTALIETAITFDNFIRQGKILYWGISEWTSEQILQLDALCKANNLIAPVCAQVAYNFLNRARVEHEYLSIYRDTNVSIIAHSPLYHGILTGKYVNGISSETRLAADKRLIPENLDDINKILLKINNISHIHGVSLTQIALFWVLQNKNICSALSSYSNTDQLLENIKIFSQEKTIQGCLEIINKVSVI